MVEIRQRKGDAQKIQERLRPSNEHSASARTTTQTQVHHTVHHAGSQAHHGGAMTNPPDKGR